MRIIKKSTGPILAKNPDLTLTRVNASSNIEFVVISSYNYLPNQYLALYDKTPDKDT